MATTNFNGGITPSNFTPTVNGYFSLIQKITEQTILTAVGFNPLDFLNKGDWANGDTLEQSVIELAQAYDFDDTAIDVFASANPNVISLLFKDWTEHQFAATVNTNQIRKCLNNELSAEDVANKVINSLSEGEYLDDYETLKGLLAYSKDTSACPNYISKYATAATGADLVKAIKNLIDDMKFTNDHNFGHGITLKSRTPVENIVICMPFTVKNALSVDTLAHIYQLKEMGVIAEIHDIDTTDGIVYVFDENAYGSRTRLRVLTNQDNQKALKSNYWLTTQRLYYYSPIFKAAYIDASAVV